VEQHAGQLARSQALRGADAVHFASALAISDPGLVVAVWDRRLRTGAQTADRSQVSSAQDRLTSSGQQQLVAEVGDQLEGAAERGDEAVQDVLGDASELVKLGGAGDVLGDG
jgi:hypothetical protein